MIDLKKIITKNPKALHDKSMLQNLLQLSYPKERRSIRILVAFIECGIINEILKTSNKTISDLDQKRFIKKMFDDYGFDEKYTKPLLELWIASLGIKSQIDNTNQTAKSQKNYSDGFYLSPF